MDQFPTLLYHKVNPEWEVGVTWVTPTLFKRQMESIASNGWRTIIPNEIDFTKTPENKRFVLIFDDGYESIYKHAFPVLDLFGFSALVFIPAGFIGKWNNWDHQLLGRQFKHLDSNMIRILCNAGWEIGSHTVTHRSLLHIPLTEVRQELTLSKTIIEDVTGKSVEWLAFPFGRYNNEIVETALECGYKNAVVLNYPSDSVERKLNFLSADAVYLFDMPVQLVRRLNRKGLIYSCGRSLRRFVNAASLGTILWKKVFPAKISNNV